MALSLYSLLPHVTTVSRSAPKFCMTSTSNKSSSKEEGGLMKKPYNNQGRKLLNKQVTHSMAPEKIEVFKSLEKWMEDSINKMHLKPVEKCWQAQDYVPNTSSECFYEDLEELRRRTKEIPDDYYVVLVGDMITEEALPTYHSLLNSFDGIRDETGASPSSWTTWIRAWTAEENRHGDLLNKYLYLSGRVDMRAIEKTIQYLIGSGMDIGAENSPYNGFIYTSFQERATFISHSNTARHAKQHGDLKLAQICGLIAADEKRHETAYTKIVEKLFEIDPNTTILALADMMRKKITMPALHMYDGHDPNLFDHFSAVAQRLGVYTTGNYIDIIEFLVGRWRVEMLTGLSPEGRKAQDYVCSLPSRFRKIEERTRERANHEPPMSFSWIFDRQVKL